MRVVTASTLLFTLSIGCTGDDGAKEDTSEQPAPTLELDAALVREVAMAGAVSVPGRIASQPLILVNFYRSSDSPCPGVVEESDGHWIVGGTSCTEEGSDAEYAGRIVVDGLRFPEGEGPAEPGEYTATWEAFAVATDTPEGPLSEATSGTATVAITEGGLGAGEVDVDWTARGMASRSMTNDDTEERVYHLKASQTRIAAGGGMATEGSGTVEIEGLGFATLDGSWAYGECDKEPGSGALTITGTTVVTLHFDGDTTCDGITPFDGALSGEVTWQSAFLSGGGGGR